MAKHVKPVGGQAYFYGRITRDEAEQILHERGCQDGLFLLRESTKKLGDYVLSLCFQNNIHHYSLESQADGKVMIENGKRFPGPVELLEYHKQHKDGLLTFPTNACGRPSGQSYIVFRGISADNFEQKLKAKAAELKLKCSANDITNRGPIRTRIINDLKMTLHQEQSWFHGEITREEAEQRLRLAGHENGKYLLRMQSKDTHEYRLSLSYRKEAKHYIVSHVNDFYFIESGPKFESLIEMVDHYHNKADGLLCPLKVPCVRPGLGEAIASPLEAGGPSVRQSHFSTASITSAQMKAERSRGAAPVVQIIQTQLSGSLTDAVWDEPPDIGRALRAMQKRGEVEVTDETQKIYDSVPTTEASFNLPRSNLQLHEKLGSGCFGSVLRGIFRQNDREIPVAVKTLKDEEGVNKTEILNEAKLMAELRHRNIVRLIGVCHAEDQIMLVLELAPMGPLNKVLKEHTRMDMKVILNIMYQVALGMRYLESQRYVHRDLAARNVLLVHDKFAKIADFGMSKALGMDGEYYKASKAGKWPLKWYAPECIYYFKFDSKSDVWSYGVTLWEATSRGGKPYQKLKGAEIIRMVDEGKRLDRPPECPADVYPIMHSCWQYEKQDRPNFVELAEKMKRYSLGT